MPCKKLHRIDHKSCHRDLMRPMHDGEEDPDLLNVREWVCILQVRRAGSMQTMNPQGSMEPFA